MYDSNKITKVCCNCTVGALIELLKSYPTHAELSICGDAQFYVHCELDESAVNIDVESLVDNYPKHDEALVEDDRFD